MILRQTAALFLDAYREMNSRKLFWIVLAITGMIVLAFGALGIDARGVTIFNYSTGIPIWTTKDTTPKSFYQDWLFAYYGVQWWFGFAGGILALISVVSVFPDMLTGGSIDQYLSKPIGRIRLFFTKFLTSMLFVTAQVLVFAVGCFL